MAYLKLVDQFAYLGSDISSTESDVDIRTVKHALVINYIEISFIKIKREFFEAVAVRTIV